MKKIVTKREEVYYNEMYHVFVLLSTLTCLDEANGTVIEYGKIETNLILDSNALKNSIYLGYL